MIKDSVKKLERTCDAHRAMLLVAVLSVSLTAQYVRPPQVWTAIAQQTAGEALVLRPRVGFPAFLRRAENLTVELVSQTTDGTCAFTLANEFGNHSLSVSVVSRSRAASRVTYTLQTRGVPPGLYDLAVTSYSPSGKVAWTKIEPNSVCIRASYDLPSKVFWVTDVHINTSPERIQNFRGIVRLANFLNPDIVVITGDVVDNPMEEYYRLARDLISDLEMPAILCGGNHDHATEGNFFEQHLAPWNGSLNFGPIHIATLDTGPGSIDGKLTDSQLVWLEKDLSAHAHMQYKVLMMHHPMFDANNPRNETVDRVYHICARHGVNLILNGHMHRDIVFRGPIFTLVNPNAYPGGRPYTGLRVLMFRADGIEWRYAGSDSSIPLYDFEIVFSQPNDGLSYGIVVNLANNWKLPVEGILRLRLKRGDRLNVEGERLGNVSYLDRYLLMDLKVTLGMQMSRRIVASTVEDRDPPRVRLRVAPTVRTGVMVNIVEFSWDVWDDVLGLEKVEMYHSSDNATWIRVELAEAQSRVFWGSIQLEKGVTKVFFYAAAWDVKEQKGSTKVQSLAIAGEKPPEQPAQVPWVLIVAAAASLAAAGFAIRFRMRKSHRVQS